MAIRNADLDKSIQRDTFYWTPGPYQSATFATVNAVGYVPTGTTLFMWGPMPYPYIIQSINAITNGASGAPQLVPIVVRGMIGGVTTIPISISNLVIANSASLLLGTTNSSLNFSGLAPVGSTLLFGQRGDMIAMSIAVANTACQALMVNMVVQRVQDVVTLDGV